MRRSIPDERANGEDMKEREIELVREGREAGKGRGLLNLFATCEHERVGWQCVTEEGRELRA